MSAGDVWLTIFLLLTATILTRCSLFLLGHRVNLPPRVQHALRYAPAAALAAIVAPDLLLSNGHLAATWMNPKLIAGLGAAIFSPNPPAARHHHCRYGLVHFATHHVVTRKPFLAGVRCGKIAVFPFFQ